jgi:hypothetical protein
MRLLTLMPSTQDMQVFDELLITIHHSTFSRFAWWCLNCSLKLIVYSGNIQHDGHKLVLLWKRAWLSSHFVASSTLLNGAGWRHVAYLKTTGFLMFKYQS